jgi:hypothetical protein
MNPIAASPPPIATPDEVRYADLADRLATHGPRAVDRELARLVEHARRHPVTPVLLTILADRDQPDVARERAFGRIVVELEAAGRSTTHRARPVTSAA